MLDTNAFTANDAVHFFLCFPVGFGRFQEVVEQKAEQPRSCFVSCDSGFVMSVHAILVEQKSIHIQEGDHVLMASNPVSIYVTVI